jgi:Na+/melibiose symporter-like transporter
MRIGLFIGPFIGAAAIPFFGLAGAYAVGVVMLVLSGILAARMPDLPGERRAAAIAAVAAAAADAAPRPTIRAVATSHASIFLTVGIGVILVSAVRASRQAVVPLWADHLGLSAATISLIYGLAGGIDMLVFYPAGKVMDRKGRAWVAVPSMLVMAAGMLCLPLANSAATLLIAALMLGFGNGIGSGMIMTLGADYSPCSRPGPVPRRLAAVRRPRLDLRAGPALRRHRGVLARRGHRLHRRGRSGRGRRALVLRAANGAAAVGLRLLAC